jgi:NAD dependent epimerase/dehydratase family enzyme
MVLPYRLGLGGKLGSGQQWVSWIGLRDLVRAMEFCLHCEAIQGPVNFVSPHPVRQAEFAEHLATVLSRRAWLAQPAWLLKLVLGTMADEVLLSSQRVEPKALLSHHFSFEDAWIQPALQKAVYEL